MILRPRQRQFVDRCVRTLRAKRSCLAVAPTAAGKTIMLSHIAREFRGSGVVLQHLIQLIDQNRAKFQKCYPEASIGVVNAESKASVCGPDGWTFAMVQTLVRNPDLICGWDLIIIDECHHAGAETYKKLIEAVRRLNPDVMVLGVSATPNRGDGKALRDVFSQCADVISVAELIRSGNLVPPRTFVRSLDGVADGVRDLREHGDDYDMSEADALMNTRSNNERVVEEWEKLCPDRKTIVFGCTVAHAAALCEAWVRRGYVADLVHGELPMRERQERMERFARGDTQVMTNCAVLTEGYDDQTVSCVCLGRPSSRKGTVIQMIGRGLRTVDPELHPGVVKTDCYVLDFGESLKAIRSLEQGVNLDGREISEEERNGDDLKVCPGCFAEVVRFASECPFCGYLFEGAVTVEEITDFVMQEISLVEASPFKWQKIFGDLVTMAAGFNAWSVVLRYNDLWFCVGGGRFAMATALAVSPIKFMALAAGDEWMHEHETDDTARKSKRWIYEPMTDKQAAVLGVTDRFAAMQYNKYMASCLILWDRNEDVIKRVVSRAAQAKQAEQGPVALIAAPEGYAECSLREMRS